MKLLVAFGGACHHEQHDVGLGAGHVIGARPRIKSDRITVAETALNFLHDLDTHARGLVAGIEVVIGRIVLGQDAQGLGAHRGAA